MPNLPFLFRLGKVLVSSQFEGVWQKIPWEESPKHAAHRRKPKREHEQAGMILGMGVESS